MLTYLGIRETRLPPLCKPCETVGELLPEIAARLELAESTLVNIGTLDHFCGMVGTGNVSEGLLSLSIGTVLGLSTLAGNPAPRDTGIPMHYGFLPGTYIMLPISESGGASLAWYKEAFLPNASYSEIDLQVAARHPGDVLFLPYLVGTNAPEFDIDACGVFFGLRNRHDAFDLGLAVMEGVAHLLKKNRDRFYDSGTKIEQILATGGGAKSVLRCQMQANITGIPVCIPAEKEAALLGAAMIGAVSSGVVLSLSDAAKQVVRFSDTFLPLSSAVNEQRHRQFLALYDAKLPVQRML